MAFRLQHSAWDQNPNHVPRSLILLPPSPHSLLGAVRWEPLGTRLPESLIDTHKQLFHMGEPQALSMNNTSVHVPVARLGLSSSAENSFSTSWYFSSLMFFWLGLWTSGSSVYLSCQKLQVLYECLPTKFVQVYVCPLTPYMSDFLPTVCHHNCEIWGTESFMTISLEYRLCAQFNVHKLISFKWRSSV